MIKDVLIVDNDKAFINGLKYSFKKEKYNVEMAFLGEEAILKAKNKDFNFIILELDMPDIDGINICKEIRRYSQVPIIVYSENDEDMVKILALEYGADDYIVKPFNVQVLKARIKAVLRRVNSLNGDENNHIIKVEDFIIDTLKRQITINENIINLTGKEFDLFYILVSNVGKIFTREELLKSVWGYDYYGDLRTVDVHIRRIREKVEKNPKELQYIMTKWGVGYYFNNI